MSNTKITNSKVMENGYKNSDNSKHLFLSLQR